MSGQFHQPRAVLRAVLESPRDIVIFALDRDYRYLAFNQNHARTMKAIWDADLTVGQTARWPARASRSSRNTARST